MRITTYRHTRMDDDAREMANFEADTNFTFFVQNIGDTEPEDGVSLTGAGYSLIDLVPGK